MMEGVTAMGSAMGLGIIIGAIIGTILGLVLLIGLSFIPSNIAKKKGYGAKLFYWFSFLLGFPPALIVALVLPARKAPENE
ncbi:MAG: hypothetical protein E7577_07065 [Ruminococcaceae bacterium]|nr:hypothetical protein [Oscillospiraceae bacterium]